MADDNKKHIWRRQNAVTAQVNNPCYDCTRSWRRPPSEDDNGCHATCFAHAMAAVINRRKNQEHRESWIPRTGIEEDKRSKYAERRKKK